MTLILPAATLILCAVSLMAFAKYMQKHMSDNENKSFVSVKAFSKGMMVYSIIMIVVTLGASVLFCTLYKDNDLFISLKRLSLLCLLWPIAYIDYRSYRIPNTFIVLGLSYRVIMLPFELIFAQYDVWMMLLSEVIAAAALFVASILCALIIKNSIGFGDIKLFVVMGLLLSLDAIWSAVFMSLIISLIISVYLLAARKKTRKDVIPFGPAIAVGTYLSVCLTGM